MRGYWHIIALSAAAAAVSVILERNFILFIFPWLTYLYFDNRIRALPLSLAIISFFFFIHYVPQLNTPKALPPELPKQHVYTGTIVDEPLINHTKIEFIMEVLPTGERYMVTHFINDEENLEFQYIEHIRYGAICEFSGDLELPRQARNPGQFDYQHFLLTKNIAYQIVIHDLKEVNCEGSALGQRFFTLRNLLMNQAPNKVSDYTASWLNALVLGDRSGIDETIIDLFQKWSLTHLLAISGLHIGIIVGIIYFGLIKLNILTREKAEWLLLLFLPVYAVLAGGEPSVLRAVLMVVILLITRRLAIKINPLDVISIAFLLLLLFDQYIIYHIGFQFSFIVTFGIILSRKWLASVHTPVFKVLIISFVSQMVILPLQMNYFSLFQPLSILLNLIIIPYFSIFVIPFMFLLLLTSFLPDTIFTVFDELFIIIHEIVLSFIDWVDRFFSFPLFLSDLPLWFFAVYYLVLLSAHYLMEKHRLKQAFIAFLLLTILIFGYASKPYFSAKGTVTMLDIGQGDAFIIELPYRKGTFMIDAGARFSFEDMEPTNSVYKQIILPYLKYKGIHKLDAVFLTHEDIDHIGSLHFMLEDGVVDHIYVSDYFPVAEYISYDDKMIQRLTSGEIVEVNGHPIIVLSPIRDKFSSNENSLVLFTELGGKNWLFTGDITKEEERELIQYYNINADVLKVGHHGSSTSTDPDFLTSIGASTAFISAGINNRYGHPTKEVIETLENNGVRIYRTDLHGAVQYEFIKDKGSFHPYIQE